MKHTVNPHFCTLTEIGSMPSAKLAGIFWRMFACLRLTGTARLCDKIAPDNMSIESSWRSTEGDQNDLSTIDIHKKQQISSTDCRSMDWNNCKRLFGNTFDFDNDGEPNSTECAMDLAAFAEMVGNSRSSRKKAIDNLPAWGSMPTTCLSQTFTQYQMV